MLLRAHAWGLRAKVVKKFDLDRRDPSPFKYDMLQNHVLNTCATTEALARIKSDGASTAPGVSPYSIKAGVPLPQIPVVVNPPAIPSEETPIPVHVTEEVPITKALNTINTKMDNKRKVFETWSLQMSKPNESRYGGYQIARV